MSGKRSKRAYGLFALAIGAAASCPASAQTPPPPAATCPVANFSSWQGPSNGSTLNFVPPNSAAFSTKSNPVGFCSFYLWASQMFLWLTSTDAAGNFTLFSPTFYTAVETPTGFTFVQNAENSLTAGLGSKSLFHVRVNKSRVSLATLLKLKAAAAQGQPTPANETGQAGGGGVLIVNGQPVAVPGNTEGYATYPIVYYTVQVNDVFAGLAQHFGEVPYFTQAGSQLGQLPTTQPQVQQIAKAANVSSYDDQDQLALEVKSAWVDAAYLPPQVAASRLLTITAEVPAFQHSAQNGLVVLTSDGTVTAQRTLALVGMHVVGTVANHPEMVWATFETPFNAPDAPYAYLINTTTVTNPNQPTCPSNDNCIATVSLSSNTASSNPYIFYNGNQPASVAPSDITITATSSTSQGKIAITFTSATSPRASPLQLAPTSAVRLNPWGNLQPSSPAVSDAVTQNNTLLLSLEASLAPQLITAGKNGGVLANYLETGALWTNGVIPKGQSNQSALKEFGSTSLANTTMETFQQSSPGSLTQAPAVQPAANCFSCHAAFNGTAASISHVFPN
jgi:hypothetical protein